METVKIDRFKIIDGPYPKDTGSSIIDFLPPDDLTTNPCLWKILATVTTGNKELDYKLIKILFDIINNDKECLKLLDNPDK